MKLTATQYGVTSTIEVATDHITIDGFHELCRRLAVAVEYDAECIEEVFGEGIDLKVDEDD